MLQNCYKKKLKGKKISRSYQRNRTPSAKRLTQTLFFKSWLRASLVIVFFTFQLKTTTTCFEQDIFYNNPAENAMNKSILRKIAGCYQNRNSSDFFVGIISPTKILRNIWNSCAENFGKLSEKCMPWRFILI